MLAWTSIKSVFGCLLRTVHSINSRALAVAVAVLWSGPSVLTLAAKRCPPGQLICLLTVTGKNGGDVVFLLIRRREDSRNLEACQDLRLPLSFSILRSPGAERRRSLDFFIPRSDARNRIVRLRQEGSNHKNIFCFESV